MIEKNKIKLLVGSISKNKTRIFRRLESRKKDLERYLYIRSEYEKGNIKNNSGFQCIYKQFYRMNIAGLTDDFFKEYFKLLASRETNLKKILLRLFDIPTRKKLKTVQFVFTTKLLHTINNNMPIYDLLVGKMLELKVTGKNPADKTNSCIKIYNQLKECHRELLNDKIIKNIILEFRIEFNCDKKKISDTKVLDFLIWTNGQLI